jgi:radical SAM protein with 4Fe4S-binding SPASM domain
MLHSLVHRLADRATSLRMRRLAREHPLRYLFLEVTRACHRACVYCGSDCSPAAAGAELTACEWIGVLRQVAEDFEPRSLMLGFTGGEPLLAPGFLDVLQEAGRLGFPFGMVSNGTLITARNAPLLVASGLGSISLSLDAPPDLNDSLRGRGATHAVEQAIAHLRRAGYSGRVEVISTLTRPAVAQLDRVRRYLARLRVTEWRLAPVIPIGRAAGRPELLPDAADLRAILDYVRRGRADGWLPVPEFGEECYLGWDYEGAVRPHRFQCRAGITVAGVRADGRIGACPELTDAFAQGDIRRERLREVWNERYRVFRDRAWARRGACGACDAFAACRGGSLHLYERPGAEPLRCLYQMLRSDGRAGNAATPLREEGPGSGSSPPPGPEDRTGTRTSGARRAGPVARC